MIHRITTRLNEEEFNYLKDISIKNNLYTNDTNHISIGKALKAILEWCKKNNIDISNDAASANDHTIKMIEHIHAAIPNLMYLSRLDILLKVNKISSDDLMKGVADTIDFINDSCGDFQNISYTKISHKINNLGIKQSPVDKEKSVWKSR